MNPEELRKLVEEKFIDDPLFKTIDKMGIKEQVFSGTLFEEVFVENTYSTREATMLLDLDGRDYQIRNYINRNELHVYLNIPRVGKQLRFDYLSLFKLKMIFVLVENGKSPLDIAALVGTRTERYSPQQPVKKKDVNSIHSPYPSTETFNTDIQEMQQNIQNLQNMFILNQIANQKAQYTQLLDSAVQDQKVWEKEMNDVVEKIEIIEWSQRLNSQISRSKSYTKELVKVINENKPKSIWNAIFGTKKVNTDLIRLFEAIESNTPLNEEDAIPESLEDKYRELIKKRNELEEKKEAVYSAAEKAKKEYGPLIAELEKKTQYLLERANSDDEIFQQAFIETMKEVGK